MQRKVESQILMSAHKYQLEFARRAKQDLRDILSYTQDEWGKRQRTEYKNKLSAALTTIIKTPDIGRHQAGVRVYPVGRHRIFYRIANSTIYIIRILHERMDVSLHL